MVGSPSRGSAVCHVEHGNVQPQPILQPRKPYTLIKNTSKHVDLCHWSHITTCARTRHCQPWPLARVGGSSGGITCRGPARERVRVHQSHHVHSNALDTFVRFYMHFMVVAGTHSGTVISTGFAGARNSPIALHVIPTCFPRQIVGTIIL